MMTEITEWLDLIFPELLDRVLGITGAVLALLFALRKKVVRWYQVHVSLRRRLSLLDEIGKAMYEADRSYLVDFVKSTRARRWDPKRFVQPTAQVKGREREYKPISVTMHVLTETTEDHDNNLNLRERTERLQTRRTTNLLAEVDRLRQVVLLGDPGSGKTTCLTQIGLRAAARGLTTQVHPLIPIFLPLSEYTSFDPEEPGKPLSVLAFAQQQLEAQTKDSSPTSIAARLDTLLRDGRALVLFDALDEMPRDDYYERFRALSRFVMMYPGNRFVFSCRLLDYIDDPNFPAQQVILASFTDRQIRTFFRRYLGKQAPDAYRHLSADGWTLGSQVHTPFLLSLLVACVESNVPPGTSWDQLISRYIDVVLERERTREIYTDSEWDALQQTTLEWLKDLAFEVTTSRATGTKADAAVVKRALADCCATSKSMKVATRAGILRDLGDSGDVRFEHHRLQEYFAALKLAELIDSGKALDERYIDDIWWREVMVLAAGLSDKPEDLVKSILGSVDESCSTSFTSTRQEFARLMLAIRCYRPARHKLSIHSQKVLTGHLIQVLRRGNVLQRVRALRTANEFDDPAVLMEVKLLLQDQDSWVRNTAFTTLSESAIKTKDFLTFLSQQMMQMVGGERVLLDGIRLLPSALRQRRTRMIAPLYLGFAILGAFRAVGVFVAGIVLLYWLVLANHLSTSEAIRLGAFPVVSYLALRILSRRTDLTIRWGVGETFNRWVVFCAFVFLAVKAIIGIPDNLVGEDRGILFHAVNAIVILGCSYLLLRFGLPGILDLVRAGRDVKDSRRRLSELREVPVARSLAERQQQADTIIRHARREPDPVARAGMIGHISTLVPLPEEILERIEEFVQQEIDSKVRTRAWQVYEQIDLSIERQLVRNSIEGKVGD